MFTLAQAAKGKAKSPPKSDSKPDAKKWESERERSRATQAQKSIEGRDIAASLPAVVDPARKKAAGESFKLFCESYFPQTFALAWSNNHLRAIKLIEAAVINGGLFAYAMPRGDGKTSMAEAAVLWSTVYGYRQFALVIGSDQSSALELLESVKKELECNDELLADFPEVCYPIRRLDGIAHRCNGQLYDGKRTHIEWTASGIVLPTIPGSQAAGCIIAVAGLTGRLRGMKFKRPDGKSVRPDLVILDDPQTDESARSPSQCATRKRLINGAVLGLAGPGKDIAALMPCTVIAPGDVSDDMLDRKKNPQWQGERTRMLESFPENESLWDKYKVIRDEGLGRGDGGKSATEFYVANRAAMDKGAAASWPQRHKKHEASAIQHAMNLRYDLGERAFFAEYQNDPLPEETGAEEMLTATEIAAKCNGIKRGIVPLGCDYVTAYIDVQGKALFYVVAAWSANGFTGAVIDYGSYPDQGRDYFALNDIKRTLQTAHPGAGQDAAIYGGLGKLSDKLLGKTWKREDGAELHITRSPIDANWGESTDTVYKFTRESKFAGIVIASHGRYVGAANVPWEHYKKRPGELLGHHWMLPSIKKSRAVRHLLLDVNYWKTFVHQRLAIAQGDKGALTLWGKTPADHRMIADHLTAEYRVRTKAQGRTVDEWKIKPTKPDNHLFDCLVGAAAAASMLGCSALEATAPPAKRQIKTRRRVSYME